MPSTLTAPRRSDPAPAEAALVARMADGDPKAFEALYDAHARAVYSYALGRLGRPGDAEEVSQEAFLRVWRHASRFDPRRGAVRAWLIGITRHLIIDRWRAEGRRAEAEAAAQESAVLDPSDDPVSRAGTQRAEAERLRGVVAGLPPEQRDVLLLVHFGGLSHREVAELTGLPLGTVKSRLRLGLERARRAVDGPMG